MAVSGTTSFNIDAREIITQALRIIRVVPSGTEPQADDSADAEVYLNLLLKTWGTHSHLWIVSEGSLSLVEGQADYSVPDARRMVSVRRRYNITPLNPIDTPMTPLSRQEYDDTPNKLTKSVPVSYYFNPQRSSRTLSVWPTADAGTATNYVLKYTYYRVIDDITSLNNDADLPQEWLEALTWSLADRLQEMHNVSYPTVTQRAAALVGQLQSQDQEDTPAFMQPNMGY